MFFISNWGMPYLFFVEVMFLAGFIPGCIIPIAGYFHIGPATKGRAAALLVSSGAISIILGNFSGYAGSIGGILVLVAGILVYSWEPPKAQPYQPLPWETADQRGISAPDYGPPGGFVTPKGARFCVSCGTQLKGREKSCPDCGTPVR